MPKEYLFSGHVQGVGFRFRTAAIARNYAVTGFVRNLRDGDVQLVVDGQPEIVRQFLDAVTSALGNHIDHVDGREFVTHEQFSAFEIRH